MSRYGSQYSVARSTGLCAASGRTLEADEPCVAALVEAEDGSGLERVDFSVEAWDAGERPARLFSHWRTRFVAPEARRGQLVDEEVLVELFERLAEDEAADRVAFRFVLALILLRKRRLKFVGRRAGRGDAPERWLMRAKGQDPESPPIEVVNPGLGDDDVEDLTARLSELLQGDV